MLSIVVCAVRLLRAVQSKTPDQATARGVSTATSNTDQRAKPWETVVEKANVDSTESDIIDVDVNPQAACDISVSA